VTLIGVLWAGRSTGAACPRCSCLRAMPGSSAPPPFDLLLRLARESRAWAYPDGLAGDDRPAAGLPPPPNAAPALDASARDVDSKFTGQRSSDSY
jgi:hypothetical protein